MLRQLYIRNFTLIDELDIDFHGGFSVITGETGAGKSIILGAIALLLGQRADMKTIKQGADKCVVEAHFDLSGYDGMGTFFDENDLEADLADTIVRRELTSSGKSRAFVNDEPVALGVLKELGDRLIDVHSQHQNLLLGKHDFQLSVLDIIADNDAQRSDYSRAYDALRQAERELDALKARIEDSRRTQDFLRFQCDELEAARLVEDEQEELEARSDTMTHAEDIKQALYQADHALSAEETGIVSQLRAAVQSLRGIARVSAGTAELADRMDSCYIELKDAAQEVGSRMEDVDFDPSELDAVNNRLDRLYELEKKYRVESVAQLIGIRDDLRRRLQAIEGSDELLAEHEQQLLAARKACQETGALLTASRRKSASAMRSVTSSKLLSLRSITTTPPCSFCRAAHSP